MRTPPRPTPGPLQPDSGWNEPILVTVDEVGLWHTRPNCDLAGIRFKTIATTAAAAARDVSGKGPTECPCCTLLELGAVLIRRGRRVDPATATWVALGCDVYWRNDHSGCVPCRDRASLGAGYHLPVHRDELGHVLLGTPIDPATPAGVLQLLAPTYPIPDGTAPVTSALLAIAWAARTRPGTSRTPQLRFDIGAAVLAPAA